LLFSPTVETAAPVMLVPLLFATEPDQLTVGVKEAELPPTVLPLLTVIGPAGAPDGTAVAIGPDPDDAA
jgi:hypothetical protein